MVFIEHLGLGFQLQNLRINDRGFSMTLSGQDSRYLLYKFINSSFPFSVSSWVLASGQLRNARRVQSNRL